MTYEIIYYALTVMAGEISVKQRGDPSAILGFTDACNQLKIHHWMGAINLPVVVNNGGGGKGRVEERGSVFNVANAKVIVSDVE